MYPVRNVRKVTEMTDGMKSRGNAVIQLIGMIDGMKNPGYSVVRMIMIVDGSVGAVRKTVKSRKILTLYHVFTN